MMNIQHDLHSVFCSILWVYTNKKVPVFDNILGGSPYSANESLVYSLVLPMPMLLLCSCSNALGCSCAGIIIHLPFIATPSIIAGSSLKVWYCCLSCLMSDLLDSQSSMVYIFQSCKCVLISVALPCMQGCLLMHWWHLCLDISKLFLHLSYTLFCPDSKSTLYRSYPGLYINTYLSIDEF